MGQFVKEPTAKSTPDVAKINAMSGRMVTVTKLVKGAARLVQPAWKNVTVDQIQGLHVSLPLQHGGGTYKFEVSEIDGKESDTWTVRLGTDLPEGFSGGDMGPTLPNVSAGDAAANSIDIGGGYRYNETLGVLVTPAREIHQWRPGQALPGALNTPQNQNPQNWFAGGQTMPGPFGSPWATGWGGYPAWSSGDEGSNSQVKALEKQLQTERERRQEDERRREMDTLRGAMEKLVADNNAKFETLVRTLTETTHKGPSEAEKALEKMEAQRREDNLRAEMREQQNKFEILIRELSTNKQDPMLTLLGTMLQTQQQGATATAQAIKDTAVAAAEQAKENARMLSERLGSSTLTPERMLEMIRIAKDQTGNTEMMKGALDMYKNLFGMSQDVLKMQAEMYQQSGEPAWVGIAQQAVDQVGRVANVYASKKAEQEMMARAAAAQRQRVQQPIQQPAPAAAPRRMVAAPPAAPPAPMSDDALRAQAESQSDKSLGAGRKKKNGASGPARPAPARRRRAAAQQPPPEPEVEEEEEEKSPSQQLIEASTEDVRAITDALSDEIFFGPFHQNVMELRAAIDSLKPEEVANFVLRAQAAAGGYGELPPCLEMLVTDHIDILVDRLLPQSSRQYRIAVGDAIRIQMRAGQADEGGDEGDDAAA